MSPLNVYILASLDLEVSDLPQFLPDLVLVQSDLVSLKPLLFFNFILYNFLEHIIPLRLFFQLLSILLGYVHLANSERLHVSPVSEVLHPYLLSLLADFSLPFHLHFGLPLLF